MRVSVVGGGISGLGAAWELMRRGHEVTLFEQGSRLGGKLQTATIDSIRVELGPDSYLRRNSSANELIESLDLSEISPAAGKALLYTRSGTQPIPAGLNLGTPLRAQQAITNHLVPPSARLRAAIGTLFPSLLPGGLSDDLGTIVTNRYGRRWADANVEPLVGGINANTIYGLSAQTSAPTIVNGPPPAPPTGGPTRPTFGTPSGGLSTLINRLEEALVAGGCRMLTSSPVLSIERRGPSEVLITTPTSVHSSQRLLLALPAYQSASLLGPLFGEGLDLLRTIHYSSVSMLIGYSKEVLPRHLLDVSGILVERDLGLLTTAISIASNKWPDWTGQTGTLLRISTGSLYDRRHLRTKDSELQETLTLEATQILDHKLPMSWERIVRWDRSFPHFQPYHSQLIAKLDTDLFDRFHGDIGVTGAYINGSGIPTCIATARLRAQQLVSV
ncbi:FAD-dependent oxidoreductase [Ferrimicrobium sp.]|uniref:protoporphyrinogen/coproporphyrinogen oxidase n=1 Tax=Ferrimicrobium sp. TaxID=2926050 RepID=UPI00260C5B87|nr:FAD-dependent oxidoreductase [Ferrimicrobium sp.]